jgi:hypothetical protein
MKKQNISYNCHQTSTYLLRSLISLHHNIQTLDLLRNKLQLLWGSLVEGSPNPIRKRTSLPSKRLNVRFSDNINYDDDSSSSLNTKYPLIQDGTRQGGKIIRSKVTGILSESELRSGIWFRANINEFFLQNRRWRLFGTRINE